MAVSPDMVVGLWLLRFAHEARVDFGVPTKVAATLAEITENLSPKVRQRARSCNVTVKRVDARNLRWIFSVDCGNGPKVVRLKARRKAVSVKSLTKMDVSVSCSCKAWQWLGPEHNADQGGYLDGNPVGTASPPDIKDPARINRVCKHVAAVLSFVKAWTLGKPKPKSKAKTAGICEVCETDRPVGEPGIVPVYVRANGTPEFSSAEYQLRRQSTYRQG